MLPAFYDVRVSTTETIQLVDELVEAKIPKPSATRLVDRIEKNKPDASENDLKWTKLENDVHWLKWIVTSLAALMLAIIGIVTYSYSDIKTEMQSMQKEINAKIDQMLIQRI